MVRLSSSDLGQALDFVREAEGVTGHSPFPVGVLDSLQRLIGADTVSWREWSIDDGCDQSSSSTTASEEAVAVWKSYRRYRFQDPLASGCPDSGPPAPAFVGRALTFSDFMSVREFRRLELHVYICRPLGIDYVMKLFLPVRDGIARSFGFDRSRRDFEERDRLVVELLQPHFVYLEENAKARRIAGALALADAEDPCNVVVLDSLDRIEFATTRAERLLREYAGDRVGSRLPVVVEAWLRHDRERLTGDTFPVPGRPLTVEGDGRRLVVRRLGDFLVLREEVASLTRRENEILELAAEGHSNAEIAASLWISPGTVRIHLQHVYKKLGVQSRTAAVGRVRQLKRIEID